MLVYDDIFYNSRAPKQALVVPAPDLQLPNFSVGLPQKPHHLSPTFYIEDYMLSSN